MKLKEYVLNSVSLILALVFSTNLQAQTEKGYILEGEIAGLKGIAKLYLCVHTGDTVARTIAKNGKFSFRGKLENDGNVYFIKLDTLILREKSRAIWLMNKKMEVWSSLTKWPEIEVTGSDAQDDYKAFSKLKKDAKLMGTDRDSLYKKFIETHTNSLYISYFISRNPSFLGPEGMKKAYGNLTLRAKRSHFGLQLKKQVDQLRYFGEVKPGAVLPDFKISTPIGKTLSVLEHTNKGKITLIDFWASWCSPCRAEIPNLKKVYDAFHDKGFNIIGISIDENESAWKKALAEEKSSWIHGRDNLEHASRGIFSIDAIPAFALVDGEGKLIAFFCASSVIPSFGPEIRGEELHKTIENLLTKKNR